jgi:exopolysaccharide biosynthesis polyprenyl glycosylphosphotransferase
MIRRHGRLLRFALATADALAVLAIVWVVSELRFGADWREVWEAFFGDPAAPAIFLALGWVAVLWSQGLYRLRQHLAFTANIKAIVRALVLMSLLIFAVLFLIKMPDVSRAFLLMALPSMALSAVVLRLGIQLLLETRRRRGHNLRNVLIVGAGPHALRFGRELESHPALGLRVIGYVNGEVHAPSLGWRFLGPYSELPNILHDHVIDEVAICLDLAEWEVIGEMAELARAEGKIVRIPLAGHAISEGTRYVEMVSGIPVMSIVHGPDRQVALAVKRVIDVFAAIIGLILWSPVMIIAAIAIALDSGRPILFRQERVGLHGRRFRLVKFRTMVEGAEDQLSELRQHNEINGPTFKLTNDPRITRVGRWLRRTSIDELPQLWNVLKGEMSLVGPRPPVPEEVRNYDPWHRRRLSMKPGITGLWQTQARREADFDRWVEKDLEYIDGWSLWLDLRIAIRTVPAMLRMEGR